MELPIKRPEKIKLREINPYLTCYLCKGYLIDATTISECLHSFCRSCIIKFLQENSFCPVCEVIINKAKPNLKLDKTLQDIVYKLVPELFLKEMTRRKQFYQQYPQIALKASPEERGEDTERTIFNPQDFISLSMEYVSDDSTPGAIRLPGSKNGIDKSKSLTPEEDQALMKRYLQCPGMCRVEVLKKFVRNKYNVDTNLFYIDVLYKRVPLPDHYTLIDIAYIYSWKRNEPMKFYFRITDLNKVSERFDYFAASQTPDIVIKTPTRAPRSNGDRSGSAKKRESASHKRISKANRQSSQANVVECDNNKGEVRVTPPNEICDASSDSQAKNKCDSTKDCTGERKDDTKSGVGSESARMDENTVETSSSVADKGSISETRVKETKTVVEVKVSPPVSTKTPVKSENCAKSKEVTVESNLLLKPEIAEQIKSKIQSEKGDNKNSVYTNITLNRTNNVEIITKIQKVSNKEGQPIGLNIIKQTVKKGAKARGSTSPAHKAAKKVPNDKKKPETQVKIDKKSVNNNKIEVTTKNDKQMAIDKKASSSSGTNAHPSNVLAEEKYKFFKSIELTAKNALESIVSKQGDIAKLPGGQKRKNSSPVKNDKAKKAKVEKKPTTKIIIQPKQPTQAKPSVPAIASLSADQKRNSGLQSLIDSCKINIPSSLSITLKESSDGRVPVLAAPVKNYIEILKLPDESNASGDKDDSETGRKVEPVSRLCDNDSEQKVDQDLSEIAKSLTEKIPLSTTVSQIVGTKPQFQIPVKSNVPVKFHIQPSPVPEVPCKVLNIPKDNKLSPRSPQTFQKIFEESIKKPDGTGQSPEKDPQKGALDLSNEPPTAVSPVKRNILEIASQLYKKTKQEHEKHHAEVKVDEASPPGPAPKVPIPRLPNQRNLKPPQKNSKFEGVDTLKYPQTLTNLHSNTLGLNYTISVGQTVPPKINGVLSPVRMDPDARTTAESPAKSPGFAASSPNSFVPPIEMPSSSPRPNSVSRNMSPILGYNSPRNSPRHSPKSSPMVKHMYAPMPNIMDQLRVQTFNQKVPSSKLNSSSPKLQASSPKLPSPSKLTSSSPKLPSSPPKMPVSSAKVAPPTSPKLRNASPKPSLPETSVKPPPVVGASPKNLSASPKTSPPSGSQNSPLSPNQLLEKYNIQNLAQLTASLNFNSGNFGINPGNQLAALQHAMLLKHFEMQNRQNWLNMNQGPLLQYEKYLQSLKSSQSHLLGNIKEN